MNFFSKKDTKKQRPTPPFGAKDLKLLKENMRKRYDSFKNPLHCRCLNRPVHFNARGFHHLLYDGSGKARTIKAARERLNLVPLIIPVLTNAIESTYEIVYVRKSRKKDSPSIKVEMWGMETIVGRSNIRVKVILRSENDGKLIFWSVMKK